MKRVAAAAATLALLTSSAAAQQVRDCDWVAHASNLVEPWEQNTATFANGAVRVAALDTVEPALGWAYLMILSPPYDELGIRQCRLVAWNNTMGFSGLDFPTLAADYDPGSGLRLTVEVQWSPDGIEMRTEILSMIVNQATGEIGAGFVP